MNKKLMALAVAGALGAPAAALAQNYSIYGRASLGIDTYEAKGATAGSAADFNKRARVFDANGSRVGFRGTEELGGGVRALFLIETGVAIDSGSTAGQDGTANVSVGNWGSRIGYVGLAGGLGEVTYGRNNVFWGNGTIDQVGANWLNVGTQANAGLLARGMAVGVTRLSNVMQYTSPTWSGVNLVVSLSPNRAEAQQQGTNADARLIAITAQGTHAPFAWGLDYVVDEGNTPNVGSANPKQGSTTGTKIRVGWRYMPDGQIALISVASVVKNNGAGNTGANSGTLVSGTGLVANCGTATVDCQLEQGAVGVSWDHMFGPYHAIVQYGTINKITGSGCTGTVCDDTGAKQITVGGRYLFSKRTHTFLSYNKITNERNYNQDFIGAAVTARAAANRAAGADPTVIAVGIVHNF